MWGYYIQIYEIFKSITQFPQLSISFAIIKDFGILRLLHIKDELQIQFFNLLYFSIASQ